MKKHFKRIIGAVLAAAVSVTTAFASVAETTDSSESTSKTSDKAALMNDDYIPQSLEIDAEEFSEKYELISKESYTDPNTGFFFVDRSYVEKDTSDTGISTASGYTPFSKKVLKSRTIFENSSSNMGDLLFIMEVQGTFSSEDVNHVWVSDAKHYNSRYNPQAEYRVAGFSYRSNQGSNLWGGHVYGFIEYIITVKFPDGHEENIRLWLDVNVLGEEHVAG